MAYDPNVTESDDREPRSAVTIKRTSTAGGKIVERKLERSILDSHEQVAALIDNAVAEFINLDTMVSEYNREGV